MLNKLCLFALPVLMSLTAFAEDVEVTDCRVFVEKAGVSYQDHEVHIVNLFLKTQDGFDSAIQSVIFYTHQHYLQNGVPIDSSAQYPAAPFLSAGNFWLVSIAVTPHNNLNAGDTSESGVFGITTEKGTRYWLRASGGQNFLLDPTLFGHLSDSVVQAGIQSGPGAPQAASPDLAIFTQKDFPYLNPNSCQ